MRVGKRGFTGRIISTVLAAVMGITLYTSVPAKQTVKADATTITTITNEAKDTATNTKTTNVTAQTGISGEEIVAKAASYINKLSYVSGGTSLETGADCSGFVCAIYEMFGINLWPYRSTSYMFTNYRWFGTYIGKDPSLAEAGDLIITMGHVAIATGKGTAISCLLQGVREHELVVGDPHHYFGGYGEAGWIIVRPNGVKANVVFNDPINGILNGVDYSSVYDFNYYSTQHPDLIKAFGDVSKAKTKDQKVALATKYLQHFINSGMREGRRASNNFYYRTYACNYEDLRKAFGGEKAKYYLHFMKYGKKEKRNAAKILNPTTVYNGVDYSAVYDFRYYQSKYPDVKKAFGEDDELTLYHFITHGMKEGRQAKATFELKSYRFANRDLRRAFGTDYVAYYKHFMKYGVHEHRVTTGVKTLQNYETVYSGPYGPNIDYSIVYDYNYYVTRYPDIKKAFGYDDKAVLEHFVKYGMREGRQAKATFNLQYYKNATRNPDLIKAFGTNINNNYRYYVHYIQHGIYEHRKGTN